MDLLFPGQLFAGRYRIERPLARGGMGAVYVARHEQTEGVVALKVLLPQLVDNERARERFKLESKVSARVRSDHIVRVHDAGLDDATNMPFLAMELLDGRSLSDEVSARGACTRTETVLYMKHIAAGLDRAHGYVDEQGVPRPIVHRDLKPENIFLTRRDDGSPLVKILDFGLAKVTSLSMDLSQEVKGTPEYMAFEQLRGGAVCAQTDIWPLGLIAFFLLSGQSYWRTVSTPDSNMQALFAELLAPHKSPPSERIRQLSGEPSWPKAFDPWFLRCLDAEPRRRFETAGAAVAELERALMQPTRPATTTLDLGERRSVAEQPTMVAERDSRGYGTSPEAPATTRRSTPVTPSWPAMRGGNSERGFDVSIVESRRLLRLECWGQWNQDLAEQYRSAVEMAMQTLSEGKPWYVLGEISRYPLQQADIAAVHGQLMQHAGELGMVRACSVVDSALTQIQIRRLAQESHMPEIAFFKDEREATRWVTRG